MNECDKATVMRKEIKIISNYRALLISKFFICICLIIASYIVGYFGYATSPVYILLIFMVLPPIFSFAFKDYSKKFNYNFLKNITEDAPFLLINMKRKYNYSRVGYVSNSITFIFTLLLLCLWKYNLNSIDHTNPLIIYLPNIIIAGGLLIRIIVIIIYQVKLPYDLSHNRL